jgi:hypothetical protein
MNGSLLLSFIHYFITMTLALTLTLPRLLSLLPFLLLVSSKSLNEYLQLSLGIERANKFVEILNSNSSESLLSFKTTAEEQQQEIISIACGSYANGGVAGTLTFLPSACLSLFF